MTRSGGSGGQSLRFELRPEDLRAVAGFAASCATSALHLFEAARPGDFRPRAAIEAGRAFAEGGPRTKLMRDSAWAAQRAAHEARDAAMPAASEAARAALAAAGAGFLHPLRRADQVKHILGAAAHAARAAELSPDSGPDAGYLHIEGLATSATPSVVNVLRQYPAAADGGGRVGALVRHLDRLLRNGR